MTHQATHSLARFFLELDADYKQFQTAKRITEAAAQTLKAQRAAYELGQITVDRCCDAIAKYAQAVAFEAQYKTTYNNAIIALEEAKGTLLEYDKIKVVEHPGTNVPEPPKPDGAVKASSVLPLAMARHESSPVAYTAPTKAGEPKPAPPRPAAVGRTISFQVTINAGSRPVEIKGSFSIGPAGSPDGATPR